MHSHTALSICPDHPPHPCVNGLQVLAEAVGLEVLLRQLGRERLDAQHGDLNCVQNAVGPATQNLSQRVRAQAVPGASAITRDAQPPKGATARTLDQSSQAVGSRLLLCGVRHLLLCGLSAALVGVGLLLQLQIAQVDACRGIVQDDILSNVLFGVSAQLSPAQLSPALAQPSLVPEAEAHTAAPACWFLVGGGVASTNLFVRGD